MLVTIILYGLLVAGGFFGAAVINRKVFTQPYK
jgi:hypothetical protein